MEKEEDKFKDQQNFIAMDNVGNPVAMQSLNGQMHYNTYNRCKRPVKSYQFVTGYHLKPPPNPDNSIRKTRERIKRARR